MISSEIDPQQLSLAALAYRCRREDEHFRHNRSFDARFGVELFRRALEDPCLESSKEAWAFVHQQFMRQTVVWVKRNKLFLASGMEPDVAAELALERMWVAFARNPGNFSGFPVSEPVKCLNYLLAYIKACIKTVLEDARLERAKADNMDDFETQIFEDTDHIQLDAFWLCVYERLRSFKERLVIDASFVNELKPRDIYELYPETFQSVQEVYRVKENIFARFRRDAGLRGCLDEWI